VTHALKGIAALWANYSYQATPVVTFDPSETNDPPHHRMNAGVSVTGPAVTASLSMESATSAFWQDVLDARFHGTTSAYAIVNASGGVHFGPDGRDHLLVKVTNLFNREVQQHVFGDVIKRQIVFELRVFAK